MTPNYCYFLYLKHAYCLVLNVSYNFGLQIIVNYRQAFMSYLSTWMHCFPLLSNKEFTFFKNILHKIWGINCFLYKIDIFLNIYSLN